MCKRGRGGQKRGMARQVRIEYEGATYHVMCRGDRRETIFGDDEDREQFSAETLRLIAAGLRTAKLTKEELCALSKSVLRKARIARAVRGQTTVPPKWLAEQLVMGSAVNVSRLTAR